MTNACPAPSELDGITEYQYEPLLADEHVRVLIVDPAEKLDDPLRCSIVQYAYTELSSGDNIRHRHYDAVSYTWGSALPTHQLRIDKPSASGTDDAVSAYLTITATVDSLLRHLRKPHKAVPLWIDAVCLNQMDPEEKAQQVPKMGHIYRGAKKVHIWLGDDNIDDARRVFSIVRGVEIRNEWNPTPDEVTLLAKFFDRPWFARRWIVQEVVLAHEARLHCGPNSIALSWVLRALKKAQSGEAGLNALVYGPKMLLSSVGKYQEAPDGCSLLALLWDLRLSECSDDRDRIAAIWGLTSFTNRPAHLFYTHGANQMYWDCAAYLADSGKVSAHTTLILHLAKFGSRRENVQSWDIPPWIPDWSTPGRPLLAYIDGLHAVLTSTHGAENPSYDSYEAYSRNCSNVYFGSHPRFKEFEQYCQSFSHKTRISFHENTLRIHSHPLAIPPHSRIVEAVYRCQSSSWKDVWSLFKDWANGINDQSHDSMMIEAMGSLLANALRDTCGIKLPIREVRYLLNSIRSSVSLYEEQIECLAGISCILSSFSLIRMGDRPAYTLGPLNAGVGDFLVPFSAPRREDHISEDPWLMTICLRHTSRAGTENAIARMDPALPFSRTVQWVGLTFHNRGQEIPWQRMDRDYVKEIFEVYCTAIENGLPGPYVFDVI